MNSHRTPRKSRFSSATYTYFLSFLRVCSFVLFFTFLFGSCKKNESTPEQQKREDIIYTSESVPSDKTVIVDASMAKGLKSVTNNSVSFLNSTPGIDRIKPGSIIVSDITEKAPGGFLRLVLSASSSNGETTYQTEQATLVDALKSANVKIHKAIKSEHIISIEDKDGKPLGGRTSGESFFRSYTTTVSGIGIEGSIGFDPDFDFDLKIENSELIHFKSALTLRNTNKIKATAESSISGGGSFVLATFKLAPFTIMIGAFPVPIANQRIILTVGADGSVSSKLIAETENINTVTGGLEYDGSWKNISDAKSDARRLTFDYERKVNLEAWLEVKYQISPYLLDNAEIYLAAKGSVIGEVNDSKCNTKAKLSVGIGLSGRARAKFIKRTIVDYSAQIFGNKYPLFSKDSSKITAETDTVRDICGSTAVSGGLIKEINPDSKIKCDVIRRGVCWSTSKHPTLRDKFSSDGQGLGKYSSKLTELSPNTTYYVRAYALTESDTIYDEKKERSFIAGDELKNVSKISIGDTLVGGIVFYITTDGKHGMVYPMPSLLPQFHADWWPDPISAPSLSNLPRSTSIGSGNTNTQVLIRPSSKPYVVGMCKDLKVGECYTDWYLPSLDELNEIYKNRKKLPGITEPYYVSSSMYDTYNGQFIYAWGINFSSGQTGGIELFRPGVTGGYWWHDQKAFIPVRSF